MKSNAVRRLDAEPDVDDATMFPARRGDRGAAVSTHARVFEALEAYVRGGARPEELAADLLRTGHAAGPVEAVALRVQQVLEEMVRGLARPRAVRAPRGRYRVAPRR